MMMLIHTYLSPLQTHNDDVSFGAIYNSDGDAHLAWENLKTIYKPISAGQKHALEQAFNHCTLTNSNTNPDDWLSELQHLRTQLLLDHKFTISDEQMISQILYNITPPMYQMTIAIIKRDLQRKITITLPELQADLRHLYN
jgi:hypothetical protein